MVKLNNARYHKVAQGTARWHKILQGSTRLVLWYRKVGKKTQSCTGQVKGNNLNKTCNEIYHFIEIS